MVLNMFKLINILCILEKNVYYIGVDWSILYFSIRSSWLVVFVFYILT